MRGPTGRVVRAVIAATALAALAGCGAAGGAAGKATGGGGSAAGGCQKGAAASGSAATIPQEPDSGVNSLKGACWASIAPTPWSNAVIGSAPAGTSAQWKAAWSPTYLYVWAQVTLGRAPICTNPSASWNDDSVEVYVSPTDDTSGAYPAGTGQYVVNACGENNQGGQGTPLGTDHTQVNITAKSDAMETVTKTGYTALLKLAWSDLGATPKAGMVIGFTIGADFADPGNPGTRLAQTMWQGDQNNWQNDSDWGTLKLG